eukprot:m.307745 g.307745  ORF g.307745 m.307745 type:complete len:263 (+) comp42755_c0_seq1:79-867(+)
MTTRKFFDDINGAVERSGPQKEKFALWIDRQQRPTMGATVRKGEGQKRQDVKDEMFLKMIESISKLLDGTEKPYLTYSAGKWQRAKQFHIKAHLRTEGFLDLTTKICREHGILENKFDSEDVKAELSTREKKDYYYKKLEEVFAIEHEDLQILDESSDYKIMTTKKILYPVAVLYDKSAETDMVEREKLTAALTALESFAIKKWRVAGCAIGMLSHSKETKFQLAIVFDEGDFVETMGKGSKAELQKNWGWEEPSRKYHRKD